MTKPDDIPQDVWEVVLDYADTYVAHETMDVETILARAIMAERERMEAALLDMYALLDLYMWHRPKDWDGGSWYGDAIESHADAVLCEAIPSVENQMSKEWSDAIRQRPRVEPYWGDAWKA